MHRVSDWFAGRFVPKSLAVALLAVLVTGMTGCAGVRWDFDYNQAQRISKQDGRPVLLYFWDWLSIDRSRMDSEVWNDPQVIAESRHVIVVPLEQGWFPDLTRKYHVNSTPTLVLLTPQGTEISRLNGVPRPEQARSSGCRPRSPE